MNTRRWLFGRTFGPAGGRAVLLCLAVAVPMLGGAATAFTAGDGSDPQRSFPPAHALRVVTLEDTPRADAPAGAPLSVQLAMAQPTSPEPDVCAAAKTQGEMTQCAYDDFLQASAAYAASQAAFSKSLPSSQRTKWLRVQSSWLKYRTAACEFESSAFEGGSLKAFVNWRCAARLTRERAAEVAARAACREGDVACVGPRR